MSFAKIDTSKITASSGRPELWIDGVKTPPILYALSDIPAAKAWKDCSQRGIKNFGNLGINIVCVDTSIHQDWSEDGIYEPLALYRDIEAVLQANPNAKVITRLHLNPPYWWLHKYPNELIEYRDKKEIGDRVTYEKPEITDSGVYGDRTIARKHLPFELRVSIASEQWKKDVCGVLEQLCKKLKEHPLGKSLIGIQVAYGHCGEWHAYERSDYGEPMRKLYCKLAKEKYKTLDKLRKFYGENADFDNLTLPEPAEFDEAFSEDLDFVLPAVKYARLIDFSRTYSYASADAISTFCKTIKESWGEGILAGAFYTYFFYTGRAENAHHETEKIFSDKNIDFLASPCAYTDNKISGNMNMIRYVAESCRINGKLMLCEMDQGYRSVNHTAGNLYVCENEEEYSSIVKRNIMENIMLGNGAWYYDHRVIPSSIYEKEEYWNNAERLQTIGKLQRVCESLEDAGYKKTTDVLVVVDAESKYYTWTSFGSSFNFINAVGKSGAGFDRLFLKDLQKTDISRYRCVLFVDCSYVSKEDYDYIKNNVFSKDRTVVIIGRFAKVVGEKANDAEKLIEEKKNQCRVIVSRDYITDPAFYKKTFAEAGAHIYTDGEEVVVADNEMVMVHTREADEIKLHLHCKDIVINPPKYSTVIYNTKTGEKIL